MTEFVVYTDGACKGNPGVGGWGACFVFANPSKGKPSTLSLKGGALQTTNNRMELLGAIKALATLENNSLVHLYTDSSYVQKGIESWIDKWVKNGWKSASKSPVKNQDLWELLLTHKKRMTIHFHWVKGHAGEEFNERADRLANEAVEDILIYQKQRQESL